MEVDCDELIQCLDDEDNIRFIPLLSDIKSMRDKGWRVSIKRVRQACNASAYYLPKLGVRSTGVDFSILEEPPWEVETFS